MTIMITIKYVLIILYADNDGEGGSFSMYSLLCRYVCRAALHTTYDTDSRVAPA